MFGKFTFHELQVRAHRFLVDLFEFSFTERWVMVARAGLASAWEVEGDRIRKHDVTYVGLNLRKICRLIMKW